MVLNILQCYFFHLEVDDICQKAEAIFLKFFILFDLGLTVQTLTSFVKGMTLNFLNLQLRDIALKRFQPTELNSLPSLVFISAFLASAGSNVTELSVHSKVISSCILL